MMLKCILGLAAVCGTVSGNAVRFAYLPPLPSEANTTLDDDTASNETLTDRFGVFQDGGGIHFEDEESGVTSLWQRRVDRVISRGVVQLALQLDHVLTPVSRPGEGRGVPGAAADSNVVFSPLSVAGALALVLLGAGGQTFHEVARVMGLAAGVELADKGSVVHEQFGRLLANFEERPGVVMPTQTVTASAIFLQEGYTIRPRFRALSQSAYRSDVVNLDFLGHGEQALQAVNAWVDTKTHGRIKNFLNEPPSPDTRLMIASALYFNGEWKYPFPLETTSKRPFYVGGQAGTPDEVLEVTMMANSADLPYYASPSLGCKVLGLPYKGGEVTMYLVLPNKTGVDALRELEDKLTPEAIEELATSTKEQSVIVLLPRMKLESTISLKNALRTLGVQSLFDPLTANLSLISPGISREDLGDSPLIFTRMGEFNVSGNEVNASKRQAPDPDRMVFRTRRQAENPGLYADDVIHKVEIEITETGTVASAVTLVTVTRDGSRQNFRLDRPFLFFIRHEATGLVLFWGSVVRPTPSAPKQ